MEKKRRRKKKEKENKNKTAFIIDLSNKKSFGTHVSVALIFTSGVAGGRARVRA